MSTAPVLSWPVDHGVRTMDPWGSGAWAAPRGANLHRGLDLIVEPDQDVIAPMTCWVNRLGICYGDDPHPQYKLIELEQDGVRVLLYYVEPLVRHGDLIERGQVIARAQDIRRRYDLRMTPHIHLQIGLYDSVLLGEGLRPPTRSSVWVNPSWLLEER